MALEQVLQVLQHVRIPLLGIAAQSSGLRNHLWKLPEIALSSFRVSKFDLPSSKARTLDFDAKYMIRIMTC